MTTDEYNGLPLEARRYIENKQGCQSCGGSSQDIDTIYKNYLVMKKGALFTLRTGAVNYKSADGERTGILYPIHPKDSEEVVKEKLETALIVYAVAPDKFSSIQEEKIEKILNPEPEQAQEQAPESKFLQLDAPKQESKFLEPDAPAQEPKQLYGAAKTSAERKQKSDDDLS